MNWYKKAIYEEFDWDIVSEYLRKKLERKPTTYEIYEEMDRRRLADSYKKELVSV